MEVAGAAVLADVVLVVEAAVEPDRRIEGAVLVDAQPGQFVAENFSVFRRGEIALGLAPIGNCARDAADKLLDAMFAFAGAVLAVEIFGDDDFRRQDRPTLRDLDVLLFEDRLAGFIRDFGSPPFPLEFIEWPHVRLAEHAGHGQAIGSAGILAFGGIRGRWNPGGDLFATRLGLTHGKHSRAGLLQINHGILLGGTGASNC